MSEEDLPGKLSSGVNPHELEDTSSKDIDRFELEDILISLESRQRAGTLCREERMTPTFRFTPSMQGSGESSLFDTSTPSTPITAALSKTAAGKDSRRLSRKFAEQCRALLANATSPWKFNKQASGCEVGTPQKAFSHRSPSNSGVEEPSSATVLLKDTGRARKADVPVIHDEATLQGGSCETSKAKTESLPEKLSKCASLVVLMLPPISPCIIRNWQCRSFLEPFPCSKQMADLKFKAICRACADFS